jgi:transposase
VYLANPRGVGRAGLSPSDTLIDAAFVTAELLVDGREEHGVRLIGPPREDANRQNRTEGAFGVEQFAIDWECEQVRCPQRHLSASSKAYAEAGRSPYVSVRFRDSHCGDCPVRSSCTRSAKQGRKLELPTRKRVRGAARNAVVYRERARPLGVRAAQRDRGDAPPGVRSCGPRRARYRSVEKAHQQYVATAVAINFSRGSAWLEGRATRGDADIAIPAVGGIKFATALESFLSQAANISAHRR